MGLEYENYPALTQMLRGARRCGLVAGTGFEPATFGL